MGLVLKSGGVVGVRDLELDGTIVSPGNDVLKKSDEVFAQVWESFSGSPRMSRNVRAILHQAGFTEIGGSASYDSYGTPEALQWFCDLIASRFESEPSFVSKAKELGIASQADLETFASAYRELGNNPDGFLAASHCEAIGLKA